MNEVPGNGQAQPTTVVKPDGRGSASDASGRNRAGADAVKPKPLGGTTRGTAPSTTRVAGTVPVTVPSSTGYIGGSSVSVDGLWSGGDLQATTDLEVPITFGGLLLAFVLIQWLIDHRDPRFVEAPARKEDDSLGFD